MIFEQFRSSLDANQPPGDASPLLVALWWEAKGNWSKAHEITQEIDSPDAASVHAYLHRKEGDEGNAGYRRSGKPHSKTSLEAEWEAIVRELIQR